MRRLTVLALLLCCCGFMSAQPEAIEKGWRNKTIKVRNGGKNPTVMQMLRAFNATWPTQAAAAIFAEAGDRLFVSNDVEEGGSGQVFVDCEDFYIASFDNGLLDGSYRLDARNYPRENGHTLFAVALQPNNGPKEGFCCFYDYNPSNYTLTPETVPYQGFKRKWENSHFFYLLGYFYDLTVVIIEQSGEEEVFHHFPYDGTSHHYSHTDTICYEEESDDETPGLECYEQKTVPISELPAGCVLQARRGTQTLYVHSGDDEPSSVWLTDGEAGTATRLCMANSTAPTQWERMTGADSDCVEVPYHLIAAADKAYFIPGEAHKFIVEGCPDARNVWTYIIDAENQTAIQLNCTEGVSAIDNTKKEITVSAYGYDDEGRYSFQKVYSPTGKMLRRLPGKTRY